MRSKTRPFAAGARPSHLATYLDRWAAACLSCEPADRLGAEVGVRQAYEAAGLKPPAHIVWCGGPLEIAERIADASVADKSGTNLKMQVFDSVRSRVDVLAEIFWKDVLVATTPNGHRSEVGTTPGAHSRVSAAVHRTVLRAADSHLNRLAIRARHALQQWRGLPRLLPSRGFDEIAVGPHDFASLGVHQYLHDALAWREPTEPLCGLWNIARNAGWIVPHEQLCWISERPSRLCADDRGRLHSPDGPALTYRDGWSAYAWKGIDVPAWMIEHPERITADTIADALDPKLRHCMIEIMTPERFIDTGAVARVSADETGILWRKRWTRRGVIIASWAAVEVVDGTSAPNGLRKRYFLRVPASLSSAREAVAWTYGLSPDQYAQLEVRT